MYTLNALCIAALSIHLGTYVDATSADVGQYIASGLKLSTHAESSSSPRSQILAGNVSSDAHYGTANTLHNGSLPANGSARISHSTLPTANASLDCWDEWVQYWSTSSITGGGSVSETKTAVNTFTSTPTYYTTTNGLYTDNYGTKTVTNVQYADPQNMNFPYATSTYTTTLTAVGSGILHEPTSTGEPSTITSTKIITFLSKVSGTAVPTPQCSLPPIVPQCQSEWDAWFAGGAQGGVTPPCAQASIDSSRCSTAISNAYADQPIWGNSALNAWMTNESSTWWPTTRSFAPSCTLGCQTCAVTGNTVQVYYWPPSTATMVENGTMTARPSALPSSGNKSEPVIAVVDNTTLTSPTVYISYAKLYASNSCSGIGRTVHNTIIPLSSSAELSSLAYHVIDDSIGFRPGHWVGGNWKYVTKSFNYDDLQEPIPESIYNQMPACQVRSHAWVTAGVGGNFTCSPHVAYAPLIAIPTQVFDIDPAWASCTGWYGGLYDPPKALQGATAIATPEVPTPVKATSASAGSKATDSLPSQTATALPADPAGSSGADSSDPNASSDDSSEKGSQSSTATSKASGSASSADESLPSSNPDTSAKADPLVDATQTGTLEASENTVDTFTQTTSRSQDPDKSGSYQAQPTKSDANALTGEADDGSSNEASRTEAAFTRPTTNALSILQSALSSVNTFEDPKTVTSSVSTEPSVVNSHVGGSEAVGEASTVGQDPKSSVTLGTQGVHATPSSISGAGSETDEEPLAESLAPGVSTTAGHQQITVLTIGSLEATASANSEGVVLQNEEETMTLSGGQAEMTFAGEALSLHPQNQLAVGSSTYAIPVQEPANTAIDISIGGKTYHPKAVSGETNAFEVAGNTLSAGGPAKTLDNGHVVSAAEAGLLIDSTSRLLIPHGATAAPSAQSKPTLVTIAGSEYTASAVSSRPSEIVIGIHTLTAGGLAATINGQTISQASDGVLVADGTTLKVPSKTLDGASAKVTYTPSSLRNGPATIASGTPDGSRSSMVTSVPMRSQGGGDSSSKTGDAHLASEGANSLSRGGISNAAITSSMTYSSSLGSSNSLDPEQTTSTTTSMAGKLECRAQRWPLAIVMAFLIMCIVL
ncbi:hypothetical protein KC318_g3534 [Hortaea werneckii]|nr:hypothetical protein KC334_g629 [Hortaea werneckii]KAI7019627.1 hypothetical protein KC355_g2990 [Hortaea werneckii]KAI7194524.1 hypothetical protein KC324_g4898 [Hortaea werneckii]KAI7587875.1 hypothetical protein KC316_g4788 [Hortaea werneckii]KAI7671376.1 hypothetical protein KC318_g3534 [Hortaea werneckii]